MVARDFYAILGCSKHATEGDLKKGYKKAAMKWHPDRHASKSAKEQEMASEKFKEVAEAYEVLTDKNKKEIYDRYGEDGLKAGDAGMPPGGRGGGMGGMGGMGGGMPPPGFASFGGGNGTTFSFSTSGSGGSRMSAARAQELFASLFGAGGLGGGRGGGMSMSFVDDDDDPFASMMGGGELMGGMMGGRGMSGGMDRARRAGARGGGGGGTAGRVDVLPPGAVVRLCELSDASKNGAVGRVEQWNEAKQRYVVSMASGGGASLSVRPHNLRQVITDATVVGTSQEALNGKTAAAATFDHASKRYRVEGLKHDGTVLSLRPENVVLPRECRVKIDGVQTRQELNGKVGTVSGVENDRYVVQLTNEAVRLKFGAVAAC